MHGDSFLPRFLQDFFLNLLVQGCALLIEKDVEIGYVLARTQGVLGNLVALKARKVRRLKGVLNGLIQYSQYFVYPRIACKKF